MRLLAGRLILREGLRFPRFLLHLFATHTTRFAVRQIHGIPIDCIGSETCSYLACEAYSKLVPQKASPALCLG